jgi:hypothetical protein
MEFRSSLEGSRKSTENLTSSGLAEWPGAALRLLDAPGFILLF